MNRPNFEELLKDRETFISKVFYGKTLKRAMLNDLEDVQELKSINGDDTSSEQAEINKLKKEIVETNSSLTDKLDEALAELGPEGVESLFRNTTLTTPNRLTGRTIIDSQSGNQSVYNRLFNHILVDVLTINKTVIYKYTKDIDKLISLNKEMHPEKYTDNNKDDFVVWIENNVSQDEIADVVERYLELRDAPQSKNTVLMLVSSVAEKLEGIKTTTLKQAKSKEMVDILLKTMKIY